jgi:hypothetical protein
MLFMKLAHLGILRDSNKNKYGMWAGLKSETG